MTSGIGNPDWQRRYDFSAVPLFSFTYNPAVTSLTSLLDANGYTNLIISINSTGTTALNDILVFWYADAAGTNLVGSTTFLPVANSTMSQKIPVMTRYYKVQTLFVTGAAGGTSTCTIYGTTSDITDLLTQNTDTPVLAFSGVVAAGATTVITAGGMYGGPITVHMSDDANNKWIGSIDYFDRTSLLWRHIYIVFGSDVGQSATQMMNLPYAPVRANLNNTDAVANNLRVVMVTP